MVVLKLTRQIDYFGVMKILKFLSCLIILAYLLNSCSEPPKRNCNNFKTGNFSFTQKINGESKTTYFERQKALQIETFETSIDTATVRWINDCEYILTNVNPKNLDEKRPVHIKILTTTDSSYTFEFNIVGESKKLRGTAIKTN